MEPSHSAVYQWLSYLKIIAKQNAIYLTDKLLQCCFQCFFRLKGKCYTYQYLPFWYQNMVGKFGANSWVGEGRHLYGGPYLPVSSLCAPVLYGGKGAHVAWGKDAGGITGHQVPTFSYFLEIVLHFPTLGKISYLFLLFKILGRVQYVILSVLYVYIVMCGVYTQGSALNLPSCRCTEMGQMSLEGTYWG